MIRLALLDAHGAGLAGLRRLLEPDTGLQVIATAPDPASLARRLNGRRADVLVLDHDPGRDDTLSLCRQVRARAGSPRVLLYTAHATPDLAAEADGLVDKGASWPEVCATIRMVASRERVAPPA